MRIARLLLVCCSAALALHEAPLAAQKNKDVVQSHDCQRCCEERRCWHGHRRLLEPPSGPVLASTPALLAPLVLTPPGGTLRQNAALEQLLLRALIDRSSADPTDAGASAAPTSSAQRTKGHDDGAPAPDPVESVDERLGRMDTKILGLQRSLDRTLDLISELNSKLNNSD